MQDFSVWKHWGLRRWGTLLEEQRGALGGAQALQNFLAARRVMLVERPGRCAVALWAFD
jgi:hypothetical protein